MGRPSGSCNKNRSSPAIWSVDPFDPKNSSTSVVISMCIKEDRSQTLEQLAERVARDKDRPVPECLAVLRDMLKSRTLGTFEYDDCNGFFFRRWEPGSKRKDDKLEKICDSILRT